MIPPKGVHFPISKLHSILALANLLAHNKLMVILLLLWARKTFGGTIYFAVDGT